MGTVPSAIESKDFSVQRTEILRQTRGLRIAHGPIKFSVGTEFYAPAVVIVGAGNVINENLIREAFAGLRIFTQPNQAILQSAVDRTIGVSHIDKVIFGELRIES